MAFDPNGNYDDQDGDYYKLWHWKNGVWRNYGYLPSQHPIHYARARPFQIKLEQDKWGLKSGWHIVILKSVYLGNDRTDWKILRLRHVGKRISENQPGYLEPNYLDDNWEILEERVFDDPYVELDTTSDHYWGHWYAGEDMGYGRGGYTPQTGLVFDTKWRDVMDDWYEYEDYTYYFQYLPTYGWKPEWGGFYFTKEFCVEIDTAPSAVMNMLAPWPGTTGRVYGALWDPYTDMEYRQPLYYNPSSQADEQPWDITNLNSYYRNWSIADPRNWPQSIRSAIYRSNFYFTGFSFNRIGDEWQEHDNILFQGGGRGKWTTLDPLNWIPSPGGYEYPAPLENSIWDLEFDCACAEENMVMAYVRRKSDGSIWKFRNYNPATDNHTDFWNLEPKPVNPTPGQEYMSFFMDGPPIPGNETWNTLMVLK